MPEGDPLWTVIAAAVIVLTATWAYNHHNQSGRDSGTRNSGEPGLGGPPPASVESPSDKDEDKNSERAIRNWTAVLAISTVFAVIFAAFTLSAIRGQLNVMEIDKRPWVAIDATIADAFRAIHVPDQNAAMSLPLDFTLSNTGEAPAVYAKIWPMLAITGPPGNPLRYSKLTCDHLRTQPITEGTATYTIFPGKTLPPLRNIFQTSRRSIEANRTAANGEVLGLVVVGCVDYGFVQRPEHHQSGFAFEVSRKAPEIAGGQCCAIDFFGNDVPAADLRVTLYPFGGFYAD